jgi:hypothetical protein
MFSTLLKHIPEPVQNMALSFGWSSFGVTVPIVLARLVASYSIPGFSSSQRFAVFCGVLRRLEAF